MKYTNIEGVFEMRYGEGGGILFYEKVKCGHRDPFFNRPGVAGAVL